MIRLFLGTWSVYWLLLLLLPIQSSQGSFLGALTIQVAFAVAVLLAIGFMKLLSGGGATVVHVEILTDAQAYKLAFLAIIASAVGVMASFYDKAGVQEVDYTQGVALARDNWRAIRENTRQLSSLYSILGYALGSFYFVSTLLLILKWPRFTSSQNITVATGILLVAISGSAVLGGRSSLLLLAAFVMAGLSLKWCGCLLRFRLSQKTIYTATALLIVGSFVAFYTMYITAKRAEMTNVPVNKYASNFLPHLNCQFSPWFEELTADYTVFQNLYSLLLSVVYLTHSFSITVAIVEYQPSMPDEGKILFTHGMNLLSKLGVGEADNAEWFLAGRFPSLPGALFHDCGWSGIIYGGLLLGLVAGGSELWLKRRPKSLLSVSCYCLIGMAIVLSPYVWAYDLLAGYFVVLSLFTACLIHFVQKSIRLL